MEPNEENLRNKRPTPHMPAALPRDSRSSLEVFNPSNYSSLPSRPPNPVYRPQSTWQSWAENPEPESKPKKFGSKPERPNAEGITSWMALKEPAITPPPPPPQAAQHQSPLVTSKAMAEIFNDHDSKTSPPSKSPATGENGAAAQRAAEWGLVLKTDEETGKLQGVKVRTSGDENTNKVGNSRRDSGNSVRSSGDLSDDGTG